MGSPAVAAFISQVTFWCLIVYGWAIGELKVKGLGLFLLLWVGGRLGLPYLPYGAAMVSSFVAALDIALVFIIFKGDVRLT